MYFSSSADAVVVVVVVAVASSVVDELMAMVMRAFMVTFFLVKVCHLYS